MTGKKKSERDEDKGRFAYEGLERVLHETVPLVAQHDCRERAGALLGLGEEALDAVAEGDHPGLCPGVGRPLRRGHALRVA